MQMVDLFKIELNGFFLFLFDLIIHLPNIIRIIDFMKNSNSPLKFFISLLIPSYLWEDLKLWIKAWNFDVCYVILTVSTHLFLFEMFALNSKNNFYIQNILLFFIFHFDFLNSSLELEQKSKIHIRKITCKIIFLSFLVGQIFIVDILFLI